MFLATSYNRPKLDTDAVWNPNGITFFSSGAIPWGISVNTNNQIFVVLQSSSEIYLWLNESTNPTRIVFSGLNRPASVFVVSNGDIYIDNGYSNGRIDQWILNTNRFVPQMYVGGSCFGLFLDVNNSLYCSINNLHRVVKKLLNDSSSVTIIIAGVGCSGSSSSMLSSPNGIFVDINLDLYVADSGNHRIQLFKSGQFNGSTVAGNGVANTIPLNYPTGIILDEDKYLFIVDRDNHRIVGSSSNGFRCLIGCEGGGSASNQLLYPSSMAFDNIGNIYVSDTNNRRIQKFVRLNKTLSKFDLFENSWSDIQLK